MVACFTGFSIQVYSVACALYFSGTRHSCFEFYVAWSISQGGVLLNVDCGYLLSISFFFFRFKIEDAASGPGIPPPASLLPRPSLIMTSRVEGMASKSPVRSRIAAQFRTPAIKPLN